MDFNIFFTVIENSKLLVIFLLKKWLLIFVRTQFVA